MCVNTLFSVPKYSGICVTVVWIFCFDKNIDAILFWIWKFMRSFSSEFWKHSGTFISILWRLSAYCGVYQNIVTFISILWRLSAYCDVYQHIVTFISILWRLSAYSYLDLKTNIKVLFQGCTNPRCMVTQVTKFCIVASNICGSSIWSWFISLSRCIEF